MEDKAVAVYKRLAKFPAFLSANIDINKDSYQTIESFWEQKDLPRNSKIVFRRLQILKDNEIIYSDVTEINELWRVKSRCSLKLCILKNKVNPKTQEVQQHLEIWTDNRKSQHIDLHILDKHGCIYSEDDIFSSLKWSNDSSKLIYIAEKKRQKACSYFSEEAQKDGVIRGAEFDYVESWGEQMTEKSQSVVCLLDLQEEHVQVVDAIPSRFSPAQASFLNGDDEIIFICYANEPKRLGIIYCPNRTSYLCKLNLKTNAFEILTKSDLCVRSPVVSPRGSEVVFLQNQAFGPHFNCSQLMLYETKTKKISTIVDLVEDCKDLEFPGIYLLKLNDNCWSEDSKSIYLTSHFYSRLQTFCVDIEKKEIKNISDNKWRGDFTYVNKKGDFLLACKSSPTQPSNLVFGKLLAEGVVEEWRDVDDASDSLDANISWTVLKHIDCEFILLKPTNVQRPPLILVNHGGPHSAFTTGFDLKLSSMCLLGYAVLLVNYRGSIGFGLKALSSLPGNIGQQEVKETHSIVLEVLSSNVVDQSHVYVTGGSHGGLITLCLIGQYPTFYKAAAVRNPVFNIAAMLGVSDIPDWIYHECGEEFDFTNLPTPNFYSSMLAKSPIAHLNQIKTPTLFMVGGQDKRVPPSQSLSCYHHLKANDVQTKLLLYPESTHALKEVNVDSDVFVNLMLWFHQFASSSSY